MEDKWKEDFRLADKYLSGDKESGEKLYSKAYGKLCGFVYKYTHNSNLSEDEKNEIIEEACMESINKMWKYNGECEFSTFLIGIAKYKCKEWIRKKANNKVVDIEEGKISEESCNYYNQDPAIIVIKKEEIEKIEIAMNMLNDDDRLIIELRDIRMMKANDISNLIGENVESIYSRHRRAIKKFKIIYEEM